MITNQEESPDPELPRLTVEEKLDRAVRNTVGRDVVSIAYAKSLGRTPEDFGGFAGKTTAFFWDDIKGKGPLAFLRHIHRFLQTDRRLEIEILRCSAEVV